MQARIIFNVTNHTRSERSEERERDREMAEDFLRFKFNFPLKCFSGNAVQLKDINRNRNRISSTITSKLSQMK